MSFELKIDPKRRVAGRFMGTVRKALILAALEEKSKRGLTQQKVADCLGVNRSVINRMLRGESNLTLRSVAELAWAMGWEPHFSLRRSVRTPLANEAQEVPPYAAALSAGTTARSASPTKLYNSTATTKNHVLMAAE